METQANRRILILDDNPAIHDDFRKILSAAAADPSLADDEAAIFGLSADANPVCCFELDFAFQGREGLERVQRAVEQQRPYALAFVDVRMPPGWDGIQTIGRLWQADPALQVVLCSAYSDYSWNQIVVSLGLSDKLLILKKPFEAAEARQLAVALTEKWSLGRQVRLRVREIEQLVAEKSQELERANAQLRASAQALERRVTERTRELEQANERLRESRDAAESANRAKSEFLAMMSHELRTPLNGVIGMLDLLLGGSLDEQQRRFASLAKLSGDTLLALISDILDFSKIEAGKIEIESAPFDLHEVVANVVRILSARALDKGLALRCAVHPHVPGKVLGDAARLQQILLNLVGNAIKFTRHGQIVVRAVPETTGDQRVTIRFVVADTGIGIAADRQARLFQPFSQADSSTTRKYGGTGLGLAICRRLAKALGGTIGVQSAADAGSTFWFTIPLSLADEACDAPPQTYLRGMRVLVVVNSSQDRAAIGAQLRSAGIQFDEAADAERGLERLQAAAHAGVPFGMAVLNLPEDGAAGDRLAESVRHDPRLHGTILVVLSAMHGRSARPEDGEPGRAADAERERKRDLLAVMAEAYAAARRELGEPAEPACRAARGPTVLAADPSARILVAEDDAIGVEVVTHLLGRMGLDHDVVANGREAVEAVRKGGYALVLMDGHMPEMDGFEATRVIREYERESRPQPPRIPIVALTANALKGDRERCLEAGMDDYLTKPIDSQRLTATMARFLARRSGAPSGEDEKTPSETSVNNAPPATPAVAAARAPRDLDLEGVIKRWGGDKAFVAPLVRKFCERTPGDLALLKQRVEAAEAPSVKELAHRLKGAASYVGAESFRGIVATLEAEAGQGDLRDAPTHLNDLRDALERCAAQARECGLIDSSTPLEPHAAEVDCG